MSTVLSEKVEAAHADVVDERDNLRAEIERLCEDWGGADAAATKEAADLRDEIERLRGVLDAIANASGAWEARATRMQNWARAALEAHEGG